jgi:hypothetical protein
MEQKQELTYKHELHVDIESTGDHCEDHKILAIAGAVLEVPLILPTEIVPPKFVDEYRVCLHVEEKDFEEQCDARFWKRDDKMRQLRARLIKEGVPRVEGLRNFHNWLTAMRVKYPNLTLVSDNKSFDLNRISFEFTKYLNEYPCTYRKNEKTGEYTLESDLDTSDFLNGVALGMNYTKLNEKFSAGRKRMIADMERELNVTYQFEHDHDPLNDAKHDAETFWYLRLWLNNKRIKNLVA